MPLFFEFLQGKGYNVKAWQLKSKLKMVSQDKEQRMDYSFIKTVIIRLITIINIEPTVIYRMRPNQAEINFIMN
jgi:hypothetical protein